MKHRTLILLVIVILATALLSSGATQARPAGQGQPQGLTIGAPPLFSYQGLLLDSTGSPVPNGTYTLTLALYDLPGGGTPLWSETQGVPVEGGLFNVTLGILTPIDPGIVDGRPLWLGVALQGEAEMMPRQNLVSVPYALNASDTRGANLHPVSVSAVTMVGTALSGSAPITGVLGVATSAAGQTYGVYGRSDSTAGTGVYGNATAASDLNYGVYGKTASTAGQGVHGAATATTGDTIGVFGAAQSTDGIGVCGSGGTGVYGVGEIGVYGSTYETDGWAGYFATSLGNGMYVSTPGANTGLTVAGGSKNAVVATAGGARLLYSEESSQVWFSDYGFGQLQDGTAVVTIDPVFAQTVNLDEPYHVFLTPRGQEFVLLLVTATDKASFTVQGVTPDGRPANCTFDYRLVALRLGYEQDRLERAPWADDDPNLYPEKCAAWDAQHPWAQPPAVLPGGAP
jgi:hypothetical protein